MQNLSQGIGDQPKDSQRPDTSQQPTGTQATIFSETGGPLAVTEVYLTDSLAMLEKKREFWESSLEEMKKKC